MRSVARWLVDREPVHLSPLRRATHLYIVGQPGTGKSRALESWIVQDIEAGRGVGVIDPHGDLFRHVVQRVSLRPRTWDRVIIVDPCASNWTVGLNPLAAIRGQSKERLSQFLTDIVVRIWRIDASSSPRMLWLLINAFLALAELDLTLLHLPQLLLDRGYRENLLHRLSNQSVREFFLLEFPKSEGAVHQWVTPVLNKIGGLIFDPDVRLLLACRPALDFRSILDNQQVFLMNLSKGILGEGTSALLGAFVVAQFQKAALSRAAVFKRVPYYLYLDEFQNYTTDNIKDVLSESRKYALSLTLAHQYLDQLSPDLRSAVLNTAGTIASFRIGFSDASRIAKEIFPSPDYLDRSPDIPILRFPNHWNSPRSGQDRRRAGWEHLALELAQLSPREFWARCRGSHRAMKLRSLDMPALKRTPHLPRRVAALTEHSGRMFGRLKNEVEAQIHEERISNPLGLNGSSSRSAKGIDRNSPRFWGD